MNLYRPQQLRELDRLAAVQLGGSMTLMRRAGEAAYRVLRERWPAAQRVQVVAGVGNNAGDGYVLAQLARADGMQVEVLQVGEAARLTGDAATAAELYYGAGGEARPLRSAVIDADVLVDALFGIGLDRPVGGEWLSAVEAINRSRLPVLALDLPSGLDATTGAVLGAAVHASVTVTFIGLKTGLFTGMAAEHRGKLLLNELGVPGDLFRQVPAAARLIERKITALPPRGRAAHKGRYGHVLVLGGDRGMAGAVRMAGEAALRAGSGLVSVATRPEQVAAVQAGRPELMCLGLTKLEDLDAWLERATVVVVGPGLGRGAWGSDLLKRALTFHGPLVVDADALNLLAEEPRQHSNWILTPHPGEAARLLRVTAAQVQADRYAALSDIVQRFDGVCVLKGAGTLVQAPDQRPWVCAAGNPGMASGGMGDVLSGVLGGLLAQGLSLAEAARVGVQLHAQAGDRAAAHGERGLLASDLLFHLRALVNGR